MQSKVEFLDWTKHAVNKENEINVIVEGFLSSIWHIIS